MIDISGHVRYPGTTKAQLAKTGPQGRYILVKVHSMEINEITCTAKIWEGGQPCFASGGMNALPIFDAILCK